MAKLDLDGDNVVTTELTVAAARELIGIDGMPDTLDSALDEAQGKVFAGDMPRAYLVVEITK